MPQKLHIFTIGHSGLTQDSLLHLLRCYNVDCVVDIRSAAASLTAPHFTGHVLQPFLKENGLHYLPFHNEFGLSADSLPSAAMSQHYDNIIRAEDFRRGMKRLMRGMESGFTIALLGISADPASCHRSFIIGRYLSEHDVDVSHIMPDASLQPQQQHSSIAIQAESRFPAAPDFLYLDAITLAYHLGLSRNDSHKTALIAAARAASDAITFMNALMNFGIHHGSRLHHQISTFISAPTFYRERYHGIIGLPPHGDHEPSFFDSQKVLYYCEPFLTSEQRQTLYDDYWWFIHNHEAQYYDKKKGTVIGAYATEPRDNASMVTRFEEYLHHRVFHKTQRISKHYEHFPADIIVAVLRRTFV